MWYFSTSVRPPVAALFPVSVALHILWLRQNFLYATVRPCIFILTHKHKFSPPTIRQRTRQNLIQKPSWLIWRKLGGFVVFHQTISSVTLIWLYRINRNKWERLIRSKFSIRNSFVQTFSDLFLFSQVSYERNTYVSTRIPGLNTRNSYIWYLPNSVHKQCRVSKCF